MNKYSEEKDDLNTKDIKKFHYKKLNLNNDYQYEFEGKEQQQTSKKPDKKELPKKPTKDDLKKFNEWVNQKEPDINRESFQKHFNFQRPGAMLKVWYTTSNKKKNNNLVILIKSGFSDLKKETENMSEEGKEIEKPNEIIDIVEKILEFKDQTQRGQGLKILTPDQMLSWWPIN